MHNREKERNLHLYDLRVGLTILHDRQQNRQTDLPVLMPSQAVHLQDLLTILHDRQPSRQARLQGRLQRLIDRTTSRRPDNLAGREEIQRRVRHLNQTMVTDTDPEILLAWFLLGLQNR